MNEQINHYQSVLPDDHSIISNENLLSTSQYIITSKPKNDDDEILVYKTLKKRLDEISKSLEKVEPFPEVKDSLILEPLFFQCISVIFIDDSVEDNTLMGSSSDSNFFYQTFRICNETRAKDVIDSCLLLWERSEDQEEFELYIIDGEKREKVEKDIKINNLFKVTKLQIKSAQFILCTRDAKFNYEDLFTNQKNANQKIVVNPFRDDHDNHYIKFISRLSGVARDVDETFQRLKNEDNENRKEKIDNKFNRNKFTSSSFLQKGILYIIFFLFFIFSFLAVDQLKDPYKDYIDTNIIKTILFGNDYLAKAQKGLTSTEYLDLLETIIGFYTYDTKNPNFKLVNLMRLTLYHSQIKTCNYDYITFFASVGEDKDLICYKYKYEDAADGVSNYYPYFENGEYERDTSICSQEDLQNDKYFVYSALQTETDNKNYISSCDDFASYLSNIFRSFKTENLQIDPIFLESTRGIFKGQINKNDINAYNSIDIFLTVSFINKAVVRKIIDILSKESLFDLVSQKASTLSYAFYSTITERYYYIGILFEHTGARVKIGDLKIIPFYPNLKSKGNGKLIYILDIFSLLFAIAIIILAIKRIYDTFQEIKQESQKKMKIASQMTNFDEVNIYKELISSLFTIDLVLDILIFIFYVIIFSIKSSKLYLDLAKVEILSTIGNDLDSYYQLNAYEYYTQAHANETLCIYEGILSLLILLRLIALIAYYERSDNFLVFIRHSIKKLFPYFAILLLLLFFFSIYSNILWGDVDKSFSSYSSAFLSTLLLSISHFPSPLTYKAKEIYSVVFYFLFFIIIIFFMSSSLPGMLIESYRITSLKVGNSYSIRQAKLFRIEEKKAQTTTKHDEKVATKNTLNVSNNFSKSINYKK